ncbi:MAG: peptidase M14 [Eudoraea sp.]|nr:peptidase M14 [Eudoraea sp.]
MSQNSSCKNFKEPTLHGRYINHSMISPLLMNLEKVYLVETLGYSVLGLPIHSVQVGNGPVKILMWSQMHGNESTTTKAVFDLLNFLQEEHATSKEILQLCTLKILPMLNPDGAEAYTRVNANGVDLNRDAKELSQPESNVLRKAYNDFKPNFCFNLHDQRTIFSAGNGSNPATVSFLAPAADNERTVTKSRLMSMKIIAGMNQYLQTMIPNQVGRYDDSFNSNCVGDTFQMLNTPTILFEAGHFQEDYEREHTRYYIFKALWKAIQLITSNNVTSFTKELYTSIPENRKYFVDVIVKNVHQMNASYSKDERVGILFKEVLHENAIELKPTIEVSGTLSKYYAHKTYDCAIPNELSLLRKQPKIVELLN